MVDAILFINTVLFIVIAVWNLIIFVIAKDIWRWIKLCYAINATILVVVFAAKLLGYKISGEAQLLTYTLLAVTMLGGTLVSWIKRQYYIHIAKTMQDAFDKSILLR